MKHEVRIELEPMSTAVFVSLFLPLAAWSSLCVGISVLFLVYTLHGAGVNLFQVLFGFYTYGLVFSLCRLARDGFSVRMIWAAPWQLGYRDVRTGGIIGLVDADPRKPVRVVRCWWQPWIHQLKAPLRVGFWTLQKSVVLAADTNRRRLAEIAEVIEAARSLPEEHEPAHVPGAFEVIVKQPTDGVQS